MSHAANVRTMTYNEAMEIACGCCRLTFNPTPPYHKSDSYATVVLQQSAQTMRRQMEELHGMPSTCARTRLLYLFLRNNRVYLQTKSWLWSFRRLHYLACIKLREFMRDLSVVPPTGKTSRCTCKAPSQAACNTRYINLFAELLKHYTDGNAFQDDVWCALSQRMCQDIVAEVMSYMFMPDQVDVKQLYQRGNCL